MNARECHTDLFDPLMCRKFIYVAKTKSDPLARHLNLKLHEFRSIETHLFSISYAPNSKSFQVDQK